MNDATTLDRNDAPRWLVFCAVGLFLISFEMAIFDTVAVAARGTLFIYCNPNGIVWIGGVKGSGYWKEVPRCFVS
jgi:hypothetical protein